MSDLTIFNRAAALATFNDTYAGNLRAALVPFKTKRGGETVIRFRWLTEHGAVCGNYTSPFQSVTGAVKAAKRHFCFSNVSAL